MSVPDVLVANDPPQGTAEPHGLIYTIREKVTESSILSYVVPSSNSPDTSFCDINSYVKWNSYCMSTAAKGSYIEIEFKDRYVFPTFYSFKGNYGNGCIAKEWYLYGLVSSSSAPEVIATDSTDESKYCTPLSSCYCGNNDWGTFAIHDAKKSIQIFYNRKQSSCVIR